jgi:hypothetical protein
MISPSAHPIRAGETWSTVLDGIALPGIAVTFDAGISELAVPGALVEIQVTARRHGRI